MNHKTSNLWNLRPPLQQRNSRFDHFYLRREFHQPVAVNRRSTTNQNGQMAVLIFYLHVHHLLATHRAIYKQRAIRVDTLLAVTQTAQQTPATVRTNISYRGVCGGRPD